ncbi:MAG TPA: GTPase HflX [Polyangiales bacterium]|nr:GTPase HflX [Polyangiales bacterium]
MKFHSKPIVEHAEVPLADDGRLDQLISHWTDRKSAPKAAVGGNACYVLSIYRRRDADGAEAQLDEIMGLVAAQGDRLVGAESHLLTKPDARTFIRSGVAERVSARARECGADMLVLDAELSPSQMRNLEDASGLPICDREAVILNVFEKHATTRRARMQVEIAHLEYLRPRIRGLGLNMDQQAGGMTKARGPGETASELLARRLDGRLADLRNGLERLKQSDSAQRKQRAGCARVVLVGYTNAGKTSLMNALTSTALSTRDRPFETLDTTSRSVTRHGGDVLLSDTVGFIRHLPERLFASFESTLAEVSEASLLLVTVDVSNPEAAKHLETTGTILDQLSSGHIPRIVVFNKVDRVTEALDHTLLAAWSGGHPYVVLSSRDPAGVTALKEQMLATVREHHREREVFVPYELSALTSRIYAQCRVLKAVSTPKGIQLRLTGEPHVVEAIVRALRSAKS